MIKKILLCSLLSCCSAALLAQEPLAINPFFAFKNSMENKIGDIDQEAAVLEKLGFDGYDHRELENLEATLAALDKHGLKLFTSYFRVNIDPGQQPYNPALQAALPLLKDRGFILWCNTHSKRYKPSDPEGDPDAVKVFRDLAALTAPYGVRIAFYPHINCWMESPMDAARLTQKVNRPNVGASFNLYHWKVLKQQKPALESMIDQLMPQCFVISINGPNRSNADLNIGPLVEDEVEDYATLLRLFRAKGFTGPVGLQTYSIKEAPEDHLKQSIAVWRKVRAALQIASP